MEYRLTKTLKVTKDGYLALEDVADGDHTNRATILLKEMRNLAKGKGGKCLSHKYYGNKSNLKFYCEKGHYFEESYFRVKRGFWCPQCSIENNAMKHKKILGKNTPLDMNIKEEIDSGEHTSSNITPNLTIVEDWKDAGRKINKTLSQKYHEVGILFRKIRRSKDWAQRNDLMIQLIDNYFNFYPQFNVERCENYVCRIKNIFRIRLQCHPKILTEIREVIYKYYKLRGVFSNYSGGAYLMFSNKTLFQLLKFINHPVHNFLSGLSEVYKAFKGTEISDAEIDNKVQEFQSSYTF